MGRRLDVLRHAALLAAGALALHQLRYLAGYGADAGAVAAAHGHGYLPWAAAAVVALVVAAGSALALALLRALRDDDRDGATAGFTRSWLTASAALAAIYSLQELAEGSLAHGHPVGLDALAANGGWTAYALALALGALVALAQRGARRAVELACRAHPTAPRPVAAPPLLAASTLVASAPRLRPLALARAGRAPPASC